MGGLLKVEGETANEIWRSDRYIIECLKISEVGTQWGRLNS